MSILFIILIVIAAIVALLLLIAAFTKKEYAIEREVAINRPTNEFGCQAEVLPDDFPPTPGYAELSSPVSKPAL